MPRISSLCLSELVLQPTHFEEIERPTTNRIPSLLRLLPEGFACQTPKHESDVFLSQPALVRRQNRMSPGSSRNKASIVQANWVGMSGELKVLAASQKQQARQKNTPRLTHTESFMSQDTGRNHDIKQKYFCFGIIYGRWGRGLILDSNKAYFAPQTATKYLVSSMSLQHRGFDPHTDLRTT